MATTRLYSNGTLGVSGLGAHGVLDEMTLPYLYTGSIYFASANSDYLSSAANSVFQANTPGGLTVEAWIYPLTVSGTLGIIGYNNIGSQSGNSSAGGWMLAFTGTAGQLYLSTYNTAGSSSTSTLNSGTTLITANTWNHVAFTCSGTVGTLWINGVNVGSNTLGSISYGAATLRVGAWNYTTPRYFNGYMTDIRITSGVQLYTTTFTPPAQKLPVLANTQLLLSTYYNNPSVNVFTDSSSYARTITVNGSGAPVSINATPVTNYPSTVTPPQRIYSNGTLQVLGSFDEETALIGVSNRLFSNGLLRTAGIFDEVTTF